MQFRRTVDPVAEPVTLDELRHHLRVTDPSENEQLLVFVRAARELCEKYLRCGLITQTWECSFDLDEISGATQFELPYAPLQSIVKVESYGIDGTGPTLFDSTAYYAVTTRRPGRIVLHLGRTWPTNLQEFAGLVVTYKVGYGDKAALVPDNRKLAVLMLAAYLYEHRGDEQVEAVQAVSELSVASLVKIPENIKMLLTMERVCRI